MIDHGHHCHRKIDAHCVHIGKAQEAHQTEDVASTREFAVNCCKQVVNYYTYLFQTATLLLLTHRIAAHNQGHMIIVALGTALVAVMRWPWP